MAKNVKCWECMNLGGLKELVPCSRDNPFPYFCKCAGKYLGSNLFAEHECDHYMFYD
jgi:hypothetical protein